MNRYAYTQNDPVNFVDPSGLMMNCFSQMTEFEGYAGFNGVLVCYIEPSFTEYNPGGHEPGGLFDGESPPNPVSEPSDCAKLVDDLVSRTQVSFLANQNAFRHQQGRRMAYYAVNTIGANSKQMPTSGFRGDLTSGTQDGDVYKHIYAHAGAMLIGNSPINGVSGQTGYQRSNAELKQDIQDAQGVGGHNRAEGEAEVNGTLAGSNVGRLMRDRIDGRITENDLRNRLTSELCAQ